MAQGTDASCSQIGKCALSGRFVRVGDVGVVWKVGHGGGQRMLKLSDSSLIFLHKNLPFSYQHFSDARPEHESRAWPTSASQPTRQTSLLSGVFV